MCKYKYYVCVYAYICTIHIYHGDHIRHDDPAAVPSDPAAVAHVDLALALALALA